MDFNQQIIEAFRANHGVVTEPVDFGSSLVLVHVPKKDGTERVTPLAAIEQESGWHVVASAAGSPRHPAWVFGLRRAQSVPIEVPGDPIRTLTATVSELEEPARAAMWERFKALSPGFAGYEAKAEGRVFPIFRLTGRD
ncbi:nitroreductase family deazaflavin-dependent oxidoreductase [Ruania suaedae]|uniref:nitroreductase/quinone reductase family protein n=1 Tax=Ruania suaedae TaxID=2897774 RepID=UPI001E5BF8E8|nr:nitroreductase/quinone reductase family protein [Ruania suaedae]UFU01805.1 nitroreductase family deazaflavin-dependent oxidoreductase [Ruania suaedae]